MQHVLTTEDDTRAIATRMAQAIGRGDILALSGDLGAGKTTFARYLIRALTGQDDLVVPSPTYTLLETYETDGDLIVWHYDAYRLERPNDILNTGFEDGLAIGAVMLIEWPDRVGNLLPVRTKMLRFSVDTDGTRMLVEDVL